MRLKVNNPSEENKKIKIQVYVPPKYYGKLDTEADKYGITISELVRAIVRDHYTPDAAH